MLTTSDASHRSHSEHVDRSALNRLHHSCSLVMNILSAIDLSLDLLEKPVVFEIRPGIKQGEGVFLGGGKGVGETPLHLVVLHDHFAHIYLVGDSSPLPCGLVHHDRPQSFLEEAVLHLIGHTQFCMFFIWKVTEVPRGMP